KNTMLAVKPPPILGDTVENSSSWSDTNGSIVPSLVPTGLPEPLWPISPTHVQFGWMLKGPGGYPPLSPEATGKLVPLITACLVPTPHDLPAWAGPDTRGEIVGGVETVGRTEALGEAG